MSVSECVSESESVCMKKVIDEKSKSSSASI